MLLEPGRLTPGQLFAYRYGPIFAIIFNLIVNFFLVKLLLWILRIKLTQKKIFFYVLLFTFGGFLIGLLGMRLTGWYWWHSVHTAPFPKYVGFTIGQRLIYDWSWFVLTSAGLAIFNLVLNLFFLNLPRQKSIIIALALSILTSPFMISILGIGKYLSNFIIRLHNIYLYKIFF